VTETQALQLDDFDNPGFVFVDDADALCATADGSEGKSRASCHEDQAEFAGLRTTLPRVEDGAVVTMEDIINDTGVNYMGAEA